MARYLLGQWLVLWHSFSWSRYFCVHAVLGAGNLMIAGSLYYVLHINYLVAVSVGHAMHAVIGFFADRNITFRSPSTQIKIGGVKYAIIEAITYCTIISMMWLGVQVLGLEPGLVRVLLASTSATAVAYYLNKHWTFMKKKYLTEFDPGD